MPSPFLFLFNLILYMAWAMLEIHTFSPKWPTVSHYLLNKPFLLSWFACLHIATIPKLKSEYLQSILFISDVHSALVEVLYSTVEPPDKWEQFSFLLKNECRGHFSVWMACRHSTLNESERNHFLLSFHSSAPPVHPVILMSWLPTDS